MFRNWFDFAMFFIPVREVRWLWIRLCLRLIMGVYGITLCALAVKLS